MVKSLLGVGLRYSHLKQFADESPSIGWVEVHSENFYSLGGPDFDYLIEIKNNYPVSLHGIGMSLGSSDGVDVRHIAMVKNLINAVNPFLVSEHLSWSSTSDKFLPDLLPFPLNKEALEVFTRNVNFVQDVLGREILLENPSTYFEYESSAMPEHEFINLLSQKTNAKVLLDVNNIYVSGKNNGWCPVEYIKNLDSSIVKEIHLAGHSEKDLGDSKMLLIDTHNNYVCDEVWDLYSLAIKRFGQIPTLLEWDLDIPDLNILLSEVKKAEKYLNEYLQKDYC
jgi:uncharacterized protein